MKYVIEQWENDTVWLTTEQGRLISTHRTSADAQDACRRWFETDAEYHDLRQVNEDYKKDCDRRYREGQDKPPFSVH